MLSGLHDNFPGVPMTALTAIATLHVKEKICAVLRDAVEEASSVNKPNIISVKKIQPFPRGMLTVLYSINQQVVGGKALKGFHGFTKVAEFCIASVLYHDKYLSGHDKLKALENWKSGDIDVMVSTSA